MSNPIEKPAKREVSITEMRSMTDAEKREVVRQAIQDLLDDPRIPEDAKRCIRGEMPLPVLPGESEVDL